MNYKGRKMNTLISIDEIKVNLSLNEISLLDALKKGNTEKITELSIQRANLKDMLIEALELQLHKNDVISLNKLKNVA